MNINEFDHRQLRLLLDGDFDAEAYWRDKPYKKWVVAVGRWNGSRFVGRTLHVGAGTRERAEATALAQVTGWKRLEARARLATPRDLGCVKAITMDEAK